MLPKKPKTVLIVDDEEDILVSLELVLGQSIPGVQVKTVNSGKAALGVMRQAPVDLIISDYRMPEMDGFRFLEEARRLSPGVPRIMMTAFPDQALAKKAIEELGVGLFIAKPFDLDYLVGVVRSIIESSPKRRAAG